MPCVGTRMYHLCQNAQKRAVVIVNANAGTVLEAGAEHFQNQILSAFVQAGWGAVVDITPGEELEARLLARLSENFDLTVVSGGDGTISKLLPILLKTKNNVGVLPLGTLNLLGSDLGFNGNVVENIEKISNGHGLSIDIAQLNDIPFHSISGVGYSAMMAREREKARRAIPFSKTLSFMWAATRTLLFAKPITVELMIDGERKLRVADGVLVTNNHFDGIPWRRNTLQDGVIEVHTFKAEGLIGRIKAIAAVARGDWRSLSTLESVTTTEAIIHPRGKRRIRVATDGEIATFRGDLRYSVLPRALNIIVAPECAAKEKIRA